MLYFPSVGQRSHRENSLNCLCEDPRLNADVISEMKKKPLIDRLNGQTSSTTGGAKRKQSYQLLRNDRRSLSNGLCAVEVNGKRSVCGDVQENTPSVFNTLKRSDLVALISY